MSLLTGIMVPRTPSRARRMEKDCCEVRSGGIVPGIGLVPLTALPKPPSAPSMSLLVSLVNCGCRKPHICKVCDVPPGSVPRSLNQVAASAPLDNNSGVTNTANKPVIDLSLVVMSNPSFFQIIVVSKQHPNMLPVPMY